MSAEDCCKGEPGGGDPRGLHSLDCPEYLAFCARLDERRPAPAAPPVVELSTSARLRETQGALAASQADLTHVEGQLREAEQERMRVERERDGVREELARMADELDDVRHDLAHRLTEMRDARDAARATIRTVAEQRDAVLAELRGLAAANRRDACTLSQPDCWGPTRAAEAYEKAAAIVEQALCNPAVAQPVAQDTGGAR